LSIAFIFSGYGCVSYNPRPIQEVPFRDRAQTQVENNIRVTAAVPGADETRTIFGIDLYRNGIQPVWLEIENNDETPVWFHPVSLDPLYFTPLEASNVFRFGFPSAAYPKMDLYFFEHGQDTYIGPNTIKKGFVFSKLDEGTKAFNVDITGEDHQVRTFTFFVPVPGLKVDHHQVDFKTLYPVNEWLDFEDDAQLIKYLENLPCCTTNKKSTATGDPLNLIVVGSANDVYHAFLRAGWDETETIYSASLWKTARSFLVGGEYRYSPVSGLYVFGRRQDIALQKARGTIHERNHLRLWLAPVRYRKKHVWVGQISRDIGVRFTWKTITTHKIDPDVDETRNYLIQDLLYSQGLKQVAFVQGVGVAPITEPRGNLTGDPYYTDGFRVVLWVSSDPIDIESLEILNWKIPPER